MRAASQGRHVFVVNPAASSRASQESAPKVSEGGPGSLMRGIVGEDEIINYDNHNGGRGMAGGMNSQFNSAGSQPFIPFDIPTSTTPCNSNIATDGTMIIPPRQALSSICSPLGDGVPKNIREKIIKGEFIDFGLLLDKSTCKSRPSPSETEVPTCTLGINAQGQLVMNEAKSHTMITSIHSWTSAFLVYAAVYLSAHPHRTQELLKYAHVIRSAASRSGAYGWRSYDEQFRLKMHRYPQNSWASMDGELWNMFIAVPSQMVFPANKGGRGGAQANFRGFGRGQKGGNRRNGGAAAGICFAFNNNSGCSYNPCKFKHACQKCNSGGHGASTCNKGAKK